MIYTRNYSHGFVSNLIISLSCSIRRLIRFVKVSWTSKTSIKFGTQSENGDGIGRYVLVGDVRSHQHKCFVRSVFIRHVLGQSPSTDSSQAVTSHNHIITTRASSITLFGSFSDDSVNLELKRLA